MPCWWQRSQQYGQTGWSSQTVTSNSNTHSLQLRCAEDHVWVHNTLKQLGYSSRGPNWVLLLLGIGRLENIAWSQKCQFLLLWHSDGKVSIWHKQHESKHFSCLVWQVKAAAIGVMVWGMFFLAHFVSPLLPMSIFKCHSLFEYCCWPRPFLYDRTAENAAQHKSQIIFGMWWNLQHLHDAIISTWTKSILLNPRPQSSEGKSGFKSALARWT